MSLARPIIFWGASGHARVLRECMERTGYRLIAVFDNDPDTVAPFPDIPLHHGEAGFNAWLRSVDHSGMACQVAIGGARGQDRLVLQQKLEAAGMEVINAIHPTAFVAADARLGKGTQVLAMAAVCSAARVGQGCIVNTRASVDHECQIADGVHIAPGAILAGCVRIDSCSMIGAGAIILPRIRIGRNVIVGAGAVVTRDILDNQVAYGNPARIRRTTTNA